MSGTPPLRVVLLAHPYRLTRFLEEQLAQTGCLVGIVHEQKHATLGSQVAFIRHLIRRDGIIATLDVVAYWLYQRLWRRQHLRRAADAILPLHLPEQALCGIPQYTVANLNHASAQEWIKALEPDVLVVHATGILKAATFRIARRYAINLHCGILPDYRGHDTMFWPLYYHDVGKLGVTLHLLEPRVDTGSILRQGQVKWDWADTDITVWFKAFALGVDLICEVITSLSKGELVAPLPPVPHHGPHYPRKGLSHFGRFALRRLWQSSS